MNPFAKIGFRQALMAWTAFVVLGLAISGSGKIAQAQTPVPDDENGIYRFMSVEKWEGSFSWIGEGAGEETVPNGALKYQTMHAANGTFEMEGPYFLYEGQNVASWEGLAVGTGSINTEITLTDEYCEDYNKWIGSGSVPGQLGESGQGYNAPPLTARLSIDLDTGEYRFAVSPESVDTSGYIRHTCGKFVTESTSSYTTQLGAGGFSNGRVNENLPDSGLFIDGSITFKDQIPQMWDISEVGGEVDWTYNWSIHPAQKNDVEMVVSPEGFDTWLPEGGSAVNNGSVGVSSIDPIAVASLKQADGPGVDIEYSGGNTLTVTAKLQGVDGAPLKQKARKFMFELMDVSKELGIAMNAPNVKARKDLPDLMFDPIKNIMVQVRTDGDYKAETTTEGIIEAKAILSANDFGAWGLLKVTAELESGQLIVGYLDGDKSQKEIRIPKREAGSKVADYWKQQQGVGGKSDDDDRELNPDGLENCNGDGLTLYEEYRGFFENGKHIRTSATRKDFFVTDRIGTAYSKGGIAMFKQASLLEVHGEMLPQEFNRDLVINFNHSAAPHVVDQHGIQVVSKPLENMLGGSVKRSGYKGLGTPGTFAYVAINTSLNPKESAEAGYRYSTIIAHELGHTVGMAEHGAGDYVVEWIGSVNDAGQPVVFEASIDPNNEELPKEVIVKREDGSIIPPDSKIFEGKDNSGVRVTIGVQSGQHSGVEACLMRYDSAWAYPSLTEPNVRYYVKGEEERSVLFCSTHMGTGVNEAGREPQSRYGEAANQRGDCIHQMCVNDRITVPQRDGSFFP